MLRSVIKFPVRVVRGIARRVFGREAKPPVDVPPPVSNGAHDDAWPAPASAAVADDPWPAPASAVVAAALVAPVEATEPVAEPEPDVVAASTDTPVPAEERPGETPTPAGERKKSKKKKPSKRVTVSGETTPNPNAMKFTCSAKVVQKGSMSFENATVAQADPLATAVFGITGVKSMFAVNDFVTVTKDGTASWDEMKSPLETAISDALSK